MKNNSVYYSWGLCPLFYFFKVDFMIMKLLVISVEQNYETSRIIEEAKKRKHLVEFILLSEKNKINPKYYDCLLIRQAEKNLPLVEKIAKRFFDSKKTVVDEKLAKKIDRNKFQNYKLISAKHLYIPKTEMFLKKNIPKIKSFNSEYVVLKPLRGKRGQGIKKVKKENLLQEFSGLKGKKYLAQEFIEIEHEYRVYVTGDKVIGGMEKLSDSWLHNIYQGAKPKKTRINSKIKNACIIAAKAVQTEIAGIDVGLTKKGLFIIEINRSPGFEGFESLGYNFAEQIIKYAETKYKKQSNSR